MPCTDAHCCLLLLLLLLLFLLLSSLTRWENATQKTCERLKAKKEQKKGHKELFTELSLSFFCQATWKHTALTFLFQGRGESDFSIFPGSIRCSRFYLRTLPKRICSICRPRVFLLSFLLSPFYFVLFLCFFFWLASRPRIRIGAFIIKQRQNSKEEKKSHQNGR